MHVLDVVPKNLRKESPRYMRIRRINTRGISGINSARAYRPPGIVWGRIPREVRREFSRECFTRLKPWRAISSQSFVASRQMIFHPMHRPSGQRDSSMTPRTIFPGSQRPLATRSISRLSDRSDHGIAMAQQVASCNPLPAAVFAASVVV